MKIAFDASILDLDRAGSARYARHLLDHLPGIDGVDDVTVLRSGAGQGGALTRRLRLLYQDLYWTPFKLARLAADADVLHCPAYRAPLGGGTPVVVTIHDVYPLQEPGSFRPWWRNYFRYAVTRAARAARRVIAASSVNADEIAELAGVERSRIRVIPYGIESAFAQPPAIEAVARARTELGLDRPFVLFVGSVEPRKNLGGALAALRRLRGAGLDLQLAVVGPPGWKNASLLSDLDSAVHEGWARRLGFVEDRQLAALYGAAVALVYPSFAEGFGFPAVEAIACGCPVVAARVGSLPEVLDDAALFVDPNEVDDIAEATRSLAEDSELRAELVARGIKRGASFRWPECARRTVGVYREAAA